MTSPSDKEDSDPERRGLIWSDTILIALVSGGAYYTARSYECGYLAYYGVGCEVASINSDIVLRIASLLLVAAFTMFQSYQALWSQELAPWFIRWRWLPLGVAACYLIPLAYWWPGLVAAKASLIIAAVVIVLAYGTPLLPIKRNGRTYLERLDHIISVVLPDTYAGFFKLSQRYGPAPIALTLCAVLVIPIVGKTMGAGRAHKQEVYKTYQGNWLLIGIYGDRAVFVESDPTALKVTGRILLKSTASENFELVTRTVGNIAPAPEESAGE